MYALFTLLAGACQSAMGSLNRMLTDYVGMFGMSLVVHAVGGILLILYMKLFVHEKLKISGMPWYLYSAGFFGIFLVVTSSYCIGVLGVSVVILSFCNRSIGDFCSDRSFRMVRCTQNSF